METVKSWGIVILLIVVIVAALVIGRAAWRDALGIIELEARVAALELKAGAQ